MKLNLDGKEVEIGGLTPKQRKMLETIKKLPMGKYYSSEGLAEKFGMHVEAFRAAVLRLGKELAGCSITVPALSGASKKLVYGSVASIAKLKRDLEASNGN